MLRLHRRGVDEQFGWVPAHGGLKGNEGANKLAKAALEKEITLPVPRGKGEGKAVIKKEWRYDREGGIKTRKEGGICLSLRIYKEREEGRKSS